MIKLDDLTMKYGERKIFDHLCFTLEDGGEYGISGASGSGKTTLIKLICSLEKATSGRIIFDENTSPKDIAIMFQEPRLFEHLSLLDNVACVIGGKIKDNREKAEKLLCVLGLSDALNKRPSEASLGMQRRAALARAMITERKILILDEPFESLDEKNAEKTKRIIEDFVKERMLILISHNREDTERFCKNGVINI